jgi:GT2 family glycosyltransferase
MLDTKIRVDTVVIIVNWNGKHLLSACLKSLSKQNYQNFEIILVDNGSDDKSVAFVQKEFPKIRIIELLENTGFAKGNNIGISQALQDKNIENVILLNNDTKVKKDFLDKLIQYQKEHRILSSELKIGALAPKMLLMAGMVKRNGVDYWRDKFVDEAEFVIDAVGARVGLDGRGYNIGHGEIDDGQYDEEREVFGFCGGAVLLKRKMLEDIVASKIHFANVQSAQICENRTFAQKSVKYQEYFDDIFFAYYEDADLNLRMRSRGWRTVAVPKAVVYHLHSATADTIKSKTFKAYYLNRNRFLMMFKNFSRKDLKKGLLLTPKSFLNKDIKRGCAQTPIFASFLKFYLRLFKKSLLIRHIYALFSKASRLNRVFAGQELEKIHQEQSLEVVPKKNNGGNEKDKIRMNDNRIKDGQERKKTKNKIRNKKIDLKRKMVMTWVMLRVVGSLIFNSRQIIKQRKINKKIAM